MRNETTERSEIARDLEMLELGIQQREPHRGKNLKALRMRFDYLVGVIRRDTCSAGARMYHVAEARAIHWALTELESCLSPVVS